MRVTISHNKTKQEVRDAADRSIDQMFKSVVAVVPVEFTDQHKQWSGDTMNFSLNARMGFIRTPIVGTVVVGDKDVTIDVDLGLLGNLIPESVIKSQVESRVRGLLT